MEMKEPPISSADGSINLIKAITIVRIPLVIDPCETLAFQSEQQHSPGVCFVTSVD